MRRRNGSTISFLRHWRGLAVQVRASRSVLIFLDFDGTLVRIAPRPDQVRLAPKILQMLKKLAANSRVTLAVMSGRRRDELRRHIGIPKIHYLGMYGWENGKNPVLSAAEEMALVRAQGELLGELAEFPGAWIESKEYSFSIHLLAAKAAVRRGIRKRVWEVLRKRRDALKCIENHRDIEVVPNCIEGKGAAVRHFLAQPAYQDALPVYFGDDLSDEPAFDALGSGISILVGNPRPTLARFRIRDPARVVTALARLEEALK